MLHAVWQALGLTSLRVYWPLFSLPSLFAAMPPFQCCLCRCCCCVSCRYAMAGDVDDVARASTMYVVFELMSEGDLEQHMGLPAPTTAGACGLTELERITVRWRCSCDRTH